MGQFVKKKLWFKYLRLIIMRKKNSMKFFFFLIKENISYWYIKNMEGKFGIGNLNLKKQGQIFVFIYKKKFEKNFVDKYKSNGNIFFTDT